MRPNSIAAIEKGLRALVLAFALASWSAVPAAAQDGWLKSGSFIGPHDLTMDLADSLTKMGGRMTAASNANVTVAGTVTDSSGPRAVTITVQSPGYLRYAEHGRAITFDGKHFTASSGGQLSTDDLRLVESLLAYFPDTVFLQLARQGSIRRVGNGFRADNGKAADYQGPWWTIYMFTPSAWEGLAPGQPLQQKIFIAIDEQTSLLSEVRAVDNSGRPDQMVMQTKVGKWFQQGTQWFPGTITRLENGHQVLQFQASQASAGTQVAPSSITIP